jgi:dipeptidyl aminopeptidase/acylaminoacyl peptidase
VPASPAARAGLEILHAIGRSSHVSLTIAPGFSGNDKFRVNAATRGKPRVLLRAAEAKNYYASIEWSADGDYIFFPRLKSAKEKDQFALWRIPSGGGQAQELNLVTAGLQGLSVNPDGQHLAFGSPGFIRKMPAIWVLENLLPATVASK